MREVYMSMDISLGIRLSQLTLVTRKLPLLPSSFYQRVTLLAIVGTRW